MTQADSTTSPSVPAPVIHQPCRQNRLAAGVAALLFCLYALLLATHMGAYAGGSDSSGYMNSAWLFGHGTTSLNQRTIPGVDAGSYSPMLYVPLGFENAPNQRMVPTYSTGVPLFVAAMSKITGWKLAAHVTMFLFSLAGVLVVAWLAREWGLPWQWTGVAALLIAACPLYLSFSLQLMSDLPAMVFCCSAVVMAWKSRVRAGWAAAGGAAFACAVLTRHTNTLLLPAVAILLGLSWRRWLLLCLGGFPGGVFYCLYNHFNYGHFFTTGYTGMEDLFSARLVPVTALLYAERLPMLLTPLVFLAAGLPFLVRREPRRILALIAWMVCILGFYSSYSFTSESIYYLRFVMPTFPALVVGSLLVLRRCLLARQAQKFQAWVIATSRRKHPPLLVFTAVIMTLAAVFLYHFARYAPKHTRYLLIALPLISIAAIHLIHRRSKAGSIAKVHLMGMTLLVSAICISDLVWNLQLGSLDTREDQALYPNVCSWAKENIPANSVIFSMQTSGALLYYTPFTLVRWDHVTPEQEPELEKICAAQGRPVYALLFPFELDLMRKTHFLDGWTKVAAMPPVTCWRLDAPGTGAPTR